MINYIGQSQKEKSNSIIRVKIKKQKSFFTLLLLALPLIFLLFEHAYIDEKITGDRMATCRLTLDGVDGNGTAFLVSKNGLLITARHCVDDNPDKDFTINFDMIKDPKYHNLKASVIYLPESENDDYAVLKLTTKIENIEPLKIAKRIEDPSSYNPDITVIGYPAIVKAQSCDSKNSVFNYYFEKDTTLFMIDKIYPGYSGGPVLNNETGEVIGICSWRIKESSSDFYNDYVGMSFCEKIQQVFTDPKASHIDW